jgi:hypothetical protein
MTGSKRMDHWTGGIVYECSEIADFPQVNHIQGYFNAVYNCAELKKITFSPIFGGVI